MIRVLILIQLVVYVVAVMLLTLLGWIADQLSRPPVPPRANDAVRADIGLHRKSANNNTDRLETVVEAPALRVQ